MIATREHGTRAKYVAERCRCQYCKEANRLYYHDRKEWVNGFMPEPTIGATKARNVIKRLRSAGYGYRHIANAIGSSSTTIANLASGETKRVRRETLAALREFEANPYPADGALVDAAEAWEIVDRLLESGWTKKAIGRKVTGRSGTLALQIRDDQVHYRTLKRLRAIEVEEDTAGRVGAGTLTCRICGLPLRSHSITKPCVS